ncbi:hypothetical protein CU048_14160 [Beijerinckiaceae bacterium]|nr:hypothetical protein CU048_14160 [Beijerinckiaceae bacterium]
MCWLKVALVSLPATMGLTVDMTNFDWLTKPVLEQANWNKRAAYFAVAAAVLQGLVAASDLV